MEYRRAKIEGGTFFFTVVTQNRRKFLCDEENIVLLRKIFKRVIKQHRFTIDAIVILPEHLHCIWTLPTNDDDFSTRWSLIKGGFSRLCHPKYKGKISLSRQSKKEQGVWQRRFWE
ncbi:MAG: transposase, partial [Rivularia sp. ALOHA_DT_140]|nr:transposase [Rivularia sp. ALOHA_DT_140]